MHPIGSILNRCFNKDKLNILTCPTHERYEQNLCKTGHNFYAIRCNGVKDWNSNYATLPKNYVLLNKERNDNQVPIEVNFDVVLSQNKFGQFQILSQFAQKFNLPLVSLEHTLAYPNWPKSQLQQLKNMRGDSNVFISEYSKKIWGWKENEADVIHHGINTGLFAPENIEKKNHVLSVCNDWINRDAPCGFRLWQDITKNLPVHVVGDTPGLSRPAQSIDELVRFYNESDVFLNTSILSPVPTSLLEAMSCGCAVVSTATCMIPEIIVNGENGFVSNDGNQLRQYCIQLLQDEKLRLKLGQNARKTILEKFSLVAFICNWQNLLSRYL